MGRKKLYNEVVNIRFPTPIIEKIDEIAKKEGKTRSDVIREIVTLILITQDKGMIVKFEKELGPIFETIFKNMFKDLAKEEIDKLNKELEEKFKGKLQKEIIEEYLKYYPEVKKKKTKK